VKLAFTIQKRIILTAIGVGLLLDVALAVVSWKLATARHTPSQELVKLSSDVKDLRADLDRVSRIRKDMPGVQQDCDRFERSLPAKTGGYSVLLGNLDSLAGKAGLQTEDVSFKQEDVAGRGLTEVEVTATVTGDYPSVVRLINGMQRSGDFYILDELELASGVQNSPGAVRVKLHLRAYFRA